MKPLSLALLLALFAVALASPAGLAIAAPPAAQANSDVQNLSSATFIAYATTTTSGANPNGVALTLSNSNSRQTFYIRNTGTLAIRRISLTITYSVSPGTTTLFRCNVGVLFQTGNNDTCASAGNTSVSASTSLTLAINPGSWYAFRLNPQNTTTPTISVSVSSAQIRLPVVSNN
jgi:hypothetical protein